MVIKVKADNINLWIPVPSVLLFNPLGYQIYKKAITRKESRNDETLLPISTRQFYHIKKGLKIAKKQLKGMPMVDIVADKGATSVQIFL